MKKNLLFFLFVATISFAQAQIPNAGFENWTNGEPDDYITLNLLVKPFAGRANVSQTDDKNSGTYAIKLETIAYTNIFTSKTDTAVGYAVLGSLAKQKGGYPFTSRPSTFSGFFKSSLSKQDTAYAAVGLYKWNEQTMKRDSIGGTIFFTATSVAEYTPFTVPFIYTSSLASPDTILVILSSSGRKKIPGSTLILDDLSLGGVTGTRTPLFSNYTPAFPNPARELLHLNNIPSSAASVEIRDLTGRLIENISATENIAVNLNNYTSGLYQYSVKTANNTVLYNDKFSVVK